MPLISPSHTVHSLSPPFNSSS
ncbi:hypothetical protein CISIN_1g0376522mg, partial [Citrus sinensis]